MADRTIKPDDTHDLVLQNNHGDSKIEVNENDTIVVTSGGDVTIDATGDIILDADGADLKLKDDGTTYGTLKQVSGDLVIQPASGEQIILNEDGGASALTIDTDGNTEIAQNIEQADGKNIQTDEVRARDGDGLKLCSDSGGEGIFVEDSGYVRIAGGNFTFDGTDVPAYFSVKGVGANGGMAFRTYYVAIGSSTSAYDTGLPIDTGGPGASALVVIKGNYGAGALTNVGLYLINFHMSGGSTPSLTHIGGSEFGGVVAGVSGASPDTLTLKITTAHNVLYQMFLFSY